MVEQVPVVSHSRRASREERKRQVRGRWASIGGVGAALGITAAVVIAPMAQGSDAAPASAPAVLPVVHNVKPVTAPLVDELPAVVVPTVIKNPPPPPPKPKVKVYSSNKSKASKDQTQVAADGDKNCGDKHYGDRDGDKG